MIRLGSALAYTFRGPEPLAKTRLPDNPGVFAVLVGSASGQYVVIDVCRSDNLREEDWAHHPHAPCWEAAKELGPKLFLAYFPSQGRRRDGIVAELMAAYEPRCADSPRPS